MLVGSGANNTYVANTNTQFSTPSQVWVHPLMGQEVDFTCKTQ